MSLLSPQFSVAVLHHRPLGVRSMDTLAPGLAGRYLPAWSLVDQENISQLGRVTMVAVGVYLCLRGLSMGIKNFGFIHDFNS